MDLVRIPPPDRTAAFVAAAAEARAVAIADGDVLLTGPGGTTAYLSFRPPDRWSIQPATLFGPPSWTQRVYDLILRHGATP